MTKLARFRLFGSILALGLVLAGLTTPTSAIADQTVYCKSKSGGDRNHCPVRNMSDKRARLYRQQGSSPCIKGRSWGTDRQGIWASRGCRGEFRITRRGHGHHDYDDNDDDKSAAAVAIGVGLAAIIAAAAADDDDDDRSDYRHHGNHGNGHSHHGDIPRFVFKACNRRADDEVRDQRHGRYAELDRIQKFKRKRNGDYRLKAYYRLYYRNSDRVRLAVCDVDQYRQVVDFRFN